MLLAEMSGLFRKEKPSAVRTDSKGDVEAVDPKSKQETRPLDCLQDPIQT